jgi:hypothetical protein
MDDRRMGEIIGKQSDAVRAERSACCIAERGPAGLMLGS